MTSSNALCLTYHVTNGGFVNSRQRLQRFQEQVRVLRSANNVDKVAQLLRHHQQHFVFIVQRIYFQHR